VEAEMSSTFMIKRTGADEEQGPFSAEAMTASYCDGTLPPSTMVRNTNERGWLPISVVMDRMGVKAPSAKPAAAYELFPMPVGQAVSIVEAVVNLKQETESILARYAAKGYCYTGQMSAVVYEKPGCLGALLGARTIERHIWFLVFEKRG